MRKPSKFTRFDTFVGISIALHLAVALGLVVFAVLPKKTPPLNLATFELIGNPPRGNGGGSSHMPRPALPEPALEEDVPSTPAPSPAEKTPVAPPVVEKAMPVPPDKSIKATPDKAKIAPSTAPDSKSKPDPKSSTATAQALPGTTGKPGREGVLNGDTLSLGGGQGVPSVMALWLSRVKYLVERNWRAPPGLAGVKEMPEIVFSVARDGRASMAQLRMRSGNQTLDRLALRAIQSVDLFPPVPDAWPEDKVVLRYVLQYAP